MNAPASLLRRSATAALLLLPFATGPLATQEIGDPITIGTRGTMPSEVLGEDRQFLVHLPAGYEANPSARYPVLYVLDGEAHFQHVIAIVDYLSTAFHIPPMIVVGVPNTDRNRDLTPAAKSTLISLADPVSGDTIVHNLSTAGGAEAFLRFLVDELAPRIERDYRTSPFRLLMGHSLAGLFTLHVAMSEPETFNAYLATSPPVQWDDRSLVRRARTNPTARRLAGRFMYMAVGALEHGDMIGSLRDFAMAMEAAEPRGLRWWHRVMPDETHVSVVHRSVYDGLETIFSDYRIRDLPLLSGDVDAMEAHFAAASDSYGYEMALPEELLNTMGYIQLQMRQQIDEAIAIFRRNVELYPGSANVYDSLADGLESAGRLDEAAENRDVAVRRAEEIGDARLDIFRSKRDALREKLATAGG